MSINAMDSEQPIVTTFAQEMIDKITLRHDRYAPMGWTTLDMKRLIWLLKGELNELESALLEPVEVGNALQVITQRDLRKKSLRDEAVDVANYALFIWYLNR